MKILVTGAGGAIGKPLCELFLASGHQVLGTYRSDKPDIEGGSLLQLSKIDLADDWDLTERVDVIIHTAGHTLPELESNARSVPEYIQSNVIGTLHLAQYAVASRPKVLIYLSTMSVYGEVPAGELTEDTPVRNPGIYGLTKYLAEMMLKEYSERFPVVSLRLPGVVGRGDFRPWVGKVAFLASRNEPIHLYSGDCPFNNVVDLPGLHRMISMVIESPPVSYEVVNLAASDPMTIKGVVGLMRSVIGSTSEVIEGDEPKSSFWINIDKARRIFRFEPMSTRAILLQYLHDNRDLLGVRVS